ncbi:hypothetical protein L1987_12550 [Smallanthus sonchifolius]|uniref:Uncharacterized protein n=1 Tax=Smallanthus sonchifolius TaxID=185202 RepID=A0ACB9JGE8_9ASTR|nr:hypothetical protein L1987_12550 [Smallanthus sonchifolius]
MSITRAKRSLRYVLFAHLQLMIPGSKGIDRKDVPPSKFKVKVLLIVNVASQCGLTSSNYSDLNQLYNKCKDQGSSISNGSSPAGIGTPDHCFEWRF